MKKQEVHDDEQQEIKETNSTTNTQVSKCLYVNINTLYGLSDMFNRYRQFFNFFFFLNENNMRYNVHRCSIA